jgi:hypothetical protein
MRPPVVLTTGLLFSVLGLALPAALPAQLASTPFPSWQGGTHLSLIPLRDSSATRSHTGTGLLIGALVGAAATTVFLVGFCSDPDTACGADEVGRAALVFLVPAAAVGALIGSLVRTEQ